MRNTILGLATGLALAFAPTTQPQAAINDLHIEITSKCVAGDVIFTVSNLGDAWPDTARMQVVRTLDDRAVRRRETRVASGDFAEIVIPGVGRSGAELALRIESDWARFSKSALAPVRCETPGS